MQIKLRPTLLALLIATTTGMAQADITIGVSLPLTGPASGLGIPTKNGIGLWPETIGGEKVKLIILDDASDTTQSSKNARRLITDDKVDLIVGSTATPASVALAEVATELKVPQISTSPVELVTGKGAWTFRVAQSTQLMANAVADHMKKEGVKTYAYLGYSDAYGEAWFKAISAAASKAGLQSVATERFNRPDTTVTAQSLKIVATKPDAILIGASGSGAAMPHKALIKSTRPTAQHRVTSYAWAAKTWKVPSSSQVWPSCQNCCQKTTHPNTWPQTSPAAMKNNTAKAQETSSPPTATTPTCC